MKDLGAVEQSAAPLKKFDFSGIRLMIAVPTRGTCSIEFAFSLARVCTFLTAQKVNHILFQHKSSCHPHFSRNVFVAEFLRSDCTHLVQIDDDMGFDPVAILQMLTYEREFIAGAGNWKTDSGQDYACKIEVNVDHTPVVDRHGLIKAGFVGGAFTIIKRSVFEKLIAENLDLRNPRVDATHGYCLYQDLYTNEGFETEDFTFCRRWTAIGGEIWIYPNITFIHSGTKDYVGNYHKFLMGLPPLAPTLESIMVGAHAPAEMTAERPRVEKNGFQKTIVRTVESMISNPEYLAKIADSIRKLEMEGVGQ